MTASIAIRMNFRRPLVLALLVTTANCGSDKTSSSSYTCENISPGIARTAATALMTNAVKGSTPGATTLIREAARELRALKSTRYTHAASVDESSGRFDFDCSSFLAYALKQSLPRAIDEILAAHPAPKTRDFVQNFMNLADPDPEFIRVQLGIDLQPGDIVAWLLPPGSQDTGHIVIVAGTPTRSADRADELLVPIVDATSRLHGAADTRGPAGGLGVGTIGLLIDEEGRLIGHRWTGGCGDGKAETTVAVRPR